jgi:ketosteroid isomerase-like protein
VSDADPVALRKLRGFFETLSLDSVGRIADIYSEDAYFKDPFNEVRGRAEIERIFRHMFDQVVTPRFIVHDAVMQGRQCFVTWDFSFRMRRFNPDQQVIRGASHLRFDDRGLVVFHRDYWDAAEELYAKLPVLGALMRFLQRRAAS